MHLVPSVLGLFAMAEVAASLPLSSPESRVGGAVDLHIGNDDNDDDNDVLVIHDVLYVDPVHDLHHLLVVDSMPDDHLNHILHVDPVYDLHHILLVDSLPNLDYLL
ncbi:MAG: hypothetical protein M1838_004633 [Thelocarpon superellum]|nr:MAG: hypothetical protein M1838_004633 [Thelocarpon superellum]